MRVGLWRRYAWGSAFGAGVFAGADAAMEGRQTAVIGTGRADRDHLGNDNRASRGVGRFMHGAAHGDLVAG